MLRDPMQFGRFEGLREAIRPKVPERRKPRGRKRVSRVRRDVV